MRNCAAASSAPTHDEALLVMKGSNQRLKTRPLKQMLLATMARWQMQSRPLRARMRRGLAASETDVSSTSCCQT